MEPYYINFRSCRHDYVKIMLCIALILFTKYSFAHNATINKTLTSKIPADTARFSFTGRVADEKGESLPGATVFIANTKWAASTDNEGKFKLSGIPPGNYEVLVRMMGFVTFTKNFTFSNKSINVNILLKTDEIALKEVNITAKPDPNRTRYLKIFTQYFIGESDNARQSKILNPDVIRFNYDKRAGILTAYATDIIKVKNDGLGYNINYLLTSFAVNERKRTFGYEGKVYFEELPGDEKQQNTWFRKRSAAYYGSAKHFFRALSAGTTTTEGFQIYKIADSELLNARVTSLTGLVRPSNLVETLKPLNPDSLIKTIDENRKLVNLSLEIKGSDTTRLYVCYMRSGEPTRFYNSSGHINIMYRNAQISRIYQINPDDILLSKNGSISPEKNVEKGGYWTWQRLADFLPDEVQTSFEMNTVVNTVSPQNGQIPVEKIHVQMDRPWYLTGDTAWMKVYVTDFNNIPITDTKICFVELIDANKRVIKNLRLPLSGGIAWGQLALNDSLVKNGAYILRAYTNSVQKNRDNFFYRSIRIIDPNSAPAKLTAHVISQQPGSVIDSLKLQLFPEGGTLVADANSRVAIMASAFGKPLNKITGYIADKTGNRITEFKINDQGVGGFYLKPPAEGNYRAVLTLPNGQEKRFALPRPQQSGIVMSVTHNDDEIVVALNSNIDNKSRYRLVAKAGDRVVYEAEKLLPPGPDSVVVLKTELPEGILEFNLYDTGNTLIARRMVYNQNKNRELKVKLTPDKPVYHPHEKINVNVDVTDADGNPVTGNFSVSVNNEADGPSVNHNSIYTDLLLNKKLNYDAGKLDAERYQELDDILLTVRAQTDDEVSIPQQQATSLLPDTSAVLQGRVYTSKGKPAESSVIGIYFPSGGPVLTAVSDNNGKFKFDDIPVKRGEPFYIVAKEKNGKELNITVDKFTPPPVTDEIMADTLEVGHANEYMEYVAKRIEDLKTGNILGTQLKEVNIKDKKKAEPSVKELVLQSSSSIGLTADQVITFIDLLDCVAPTLADCLAMKLHNVTAVGGPGNKSLIANGRSIIPMAVFVDGVERSGALSTLSISAIESVEVLKGANAAAYGIRSGNGVLVITTKKGGIDYWAYEQEHYVPGSTKTSPVKLYKFENGFDVSNDFYTPDYRKPQATNIDKWRPTIYWNPNLLTGTDGKAQISYFTNSAPGTYRVTIEGIDGNGRIARQMFSYIVSE